MVKIKGQIKSESDAINRGYLENRNPYVLIFDVRGLYEEGGQGLVPINVETLEDYGLNVPTMERLASAYYTKIWCDSTGEVWNYCCQGSIRGGNIKLRMWLGYNCQDENFAFIEIQLSNGNYYIKTRESA